MGAPGPTQVYTAGDRGFRGPQLNWAQGSEGQGGGSCPRECEGYHPCVCCHFSSSPTCNGGQDHDPHDNDGETDIPGTDMPGSQSPISLAQKSLKAGRDQNLSSCLNLAKLHPWPTHDEQLSISTASPSGHPSPVSSHRRNGLFVLPALWCSLGRGPEEMTIFCLGGQIDSRGRKGTMGRIRLGPLAHPGPV